MIEPYSFGSWLAQQRRKRDLTQTALAMQVGCATITIKKIESEARKPSEQMALRLAQILAIPLEQRDSFVQAAHSGRVPIPPKPINPRSFLPATRNMFFGRIEEQIRLAALLKGLTNRLVTLVGPPGVGKTRLALQVSWAVQGSFPGGVYWLDMAPITAAEDIAAVACQGLGLPEGAERPTTRLIGWLSTRKVLLVLDNCEQISSPGQVVSHLLDNASHLSLLLTSRIALDVYGERIFPVAPLPVGERPSHPEKLANHPALALFQARVQEVRPQFFVTAENLDIVTHICRELDGLPLAIELAARQLRYATLEGIHIQINRRLELLKQGPVDWKPRQQTFRAAVQWSLSLLQEEAQRHFARLGVFSGGFMAEAAVALTSQTSFQNLLLASLIQKSGDDRYFLLKTVQDYALELLGQRDETNPAREAHARYFRDLVGKAYPQWRTAAIVSWQELMAKERNNIQAALNWCLDNDSALGLELATDMWLFWYLWGQYRTGIRWLGQFLEQAAEPTLTRARALRGVGVLFTRFGEFEKAQPFFSESLQIASGLENHYHIGTALMGLADCYYGLNQIEKSRPYYQEALKQFETIEDLHAISWALNNLANVAYKQDHDLLKGIEINKQAIDYARKINEPRHVGWVLSVAADLESTAGNRQTAEVMLAEARGFFQISGDLPGQSYANLRLGALALHNGRYMEARTRLEDALHLARETFTPSYEAQALCLLGIIEIHQGKGKQGLELITQAEKTHRFLRKRLLADDIVLLEDYLKKCNAM